MCSKLKLLLCVTALAAVAHAKSFEHFRKWEVETTAGPKVFWESQIRGTWLEAQLACVNNGTSLITIKNELAQEAIATALMFYNAGNEEYWISLHRQRAELPWVWGDGTPMTYSNWWYSPPENRTTTAATIHGFTSMHFAKWHDMVLDNRYFYICQ